MSDQNTPYRYGIDDLGDAPLGGDQPQAADPNDPAADDPVVTTSAFRKAVLELLTEIRDAVVEDAP